MFTFQNILCITFTLLTQSIAQNTFDKLNKWNVYLTFFFFVLWIYCIEWQVAYTFFSFTNSIQTTLVPYNLFIWFFSLLKCCLCSFQHSKFDKTHKTFYECCEWLCSIFFSNKDTIIYAVTTIDCNESLHLQNTAWLFNHE